MTTRIERAEERIHAFLDQQSKRVFQYSDLNEILQEQRAEWNLAQSTSTTGFLQFLSGPGKLQLVELDFPWRREKRYVWRSSALPEVLMTVKPNCYFSHFAAMQMHDLTEQDPTTLYLNFEQTPKPQSGSLTQQGIDNAFRRPQRKATNITEVDGYRVCLLNGKHSGYVGVETRSIRWGSEEIEVRLSDVERTLIDITVRPDYSGGPDAVLKAFTRAGSLASANRIAAYLSKLRYVYPYHQAIGFYMERSGSFTETAIVRFKERFETEYDFYLAYGMKNTRYDANWRLHVPAWM